MSCFPLRKAGVSKIKFCFRAGSVWTVGITVEIMVCFQISWACERCLRSGSFLTSRFGFLAQDWFGRRKGDHFSLPQLLDWRVNEWKWVKADESYREKKRVKCYFSFGSLVFGSFSVSAGKNVARSCPLNENLLDEGARRNICFVARPTGLYLKLGMAWQTSHGAV